MINADRHGMAPCACGGTRHFTADRCPRCMGPSAAVLEPVSLTVGCRTAAEVRAEADAARTAASGPPRPSAGHHNPRWGGS